MTDKVDRPIGLEALKGFRYGAVGGCEGRYAGSRQGLECLRADVAGNDSLDAQVGQQLGALNSCSLRGV